MEDIVKWLIGLVVVLGIAAGVIFGGYYIVTQYIIAPTYSVEHATMYSAGVDADWAYAQNRKEFDVGSTVYMKYKVAITSSNKKGDGQEVYVTISVPKVNSVDAYYQDGNPITSVEDAINNVTTYTFPVVASKSDPQEFICIFKYVPNAEGSITITIVYDDQVKQSYDWQSTINFVQSAEE